MKHPLPWTLDPVEGMYDAAGHHVTEAEAVEFVNTIAGVLDAVEGAVEITQKYARLRAAGWEVGDDGDPYQPDGS